ncbi:hypothetical protein [Candidatus Stoquefichus massiliensis]|uniref:hypothetical protein n=1 Tax=Candidatus Stoquefichus massiliensis TaxID=1470350 RepID=UPI000677F4B6|nr:hypothetical protein [Candidatus Stoquefichus massiliensis]
MDRLNTAWGKLYKTDLIKNITFVDTSKIGIEDGWFNIMVFSKIKGDVIYLEDTWYHYEKENSVSLLHSYKTQYEEKRWRFYNLVSQYLEDNELGSYTINLNNRIVMELFSIILNIENSDTNIKKKVNKVEQIINTNNYKKLFDTFQSNNLSLIWMIFFKMCKKELYFEIFIFFRIYKLLRGVK